MMSRTFKALLLVAAAALAFAPAHAQSGRTPPPAPTPAHAPAPAPPDASNSEKVKLVVSEGFENFVRDLNEQGRLGYRLEKSAAYGGVGPRQTYAAVLRLDAGHAYDYDWMSSPNRDLLDLRLNHQAKRGFNLVGTYAVTRCEGERDDEDPGDASGPNSAALRMLRTLKGNVFLFARRDGAAAQSREYRVFTAKLGPRKDTKQAVQAAFDAAPPGFRPVRLLFSKTGWLDFRVAVVAERDLGEAAPARVEYRMVKEVTGFEKEVNKLAAEGARFVGGGRVGSVKMAVMALPAQAAEPTAYTFIDDDKHAKEFDRAVAAGHNYHGLMAGDLTCDEDEVVSQKLVFARPAAAGAGREYRVLSLLDPKAGGLSASALAEFRRLSAEGFQARDLFHARGALNLILEK